MLNCGIIGFGKMGQIRRDAIIGSGLGKIIAIYDPNKTALVEGNKGDSPEKVISNKNIDAIFIATPNSENKRLTIAGLNAGKHVFCEKPPAFSVADVVEIQDAERKSGRKLMYGFNHRHHDSIIQMKQLIDSGNYGKILWMRGRYGKSVDHNYFNTWRASKTLAGGGILLDQGIHMLDLFLLLAESFDEVQAMVSNLYWNLDGIEDNVFANLRNNKSGIVASLHSTMTQWRHLFSLEVFLEKGYIVLNGLLTKSLSYGDEILTVAKNRSTAPAAKWEDEEKYKFSIDNSWQTETSLFLNAVIKDEAINSGNSEDAYKVMELIDRIYREKWHPAGDLNQTQ